MHTVARGFFLTLLAAEVLLLIRLVERPQCRSCGTGCVFAGGVNESLRSFVRPRLSSFAVLITAPGRIRGRLRGERGALDSDGGLIM